MRRHQDARQVALRLDADINLELAVEEEDLTSSEHLLGRVGDTALDSWFFAGDDRLVTDVWSAGRHMVEDGQHVQRAEIVTAYKQVINALRDDL